MTYQVEKFVKTVKTSSQIDGNAYEWQSTDCAFDHFSNAVLYAKALIRNQFIIGYRICDSNGNIWFAQ